MSRPVLQPVIPLANAATLVVVSGLIAGCGGSGQDPSFEAGGPIGRTKAIGDAAAAGDPGAIPNLIESLWSDDPAERMLAIRALESMTGQTLGYGFADPEQKRTEAADRWVTWWRADRARSAPGATPPAATGASGGL